MISLWVKFVKLYKFIYLLRYLNLFPVLYELHRPCIVSVSKVTWCVDVILFRVSIFNEVMNIMH